jgi:hypothetical protein
MRPNALVRIALATALAAASCSASDDGPVAQPVPASAGQSGRFDHSAWDRVLARHVRPGRIHGVDVAVVDYEALRRGDADYDAYLGQLAAADLSGLSRAELLALWINAYNALCIKVVLDHWPLESIRDAGGKIFGQVWKKPAGTVAGKVRSLDEIEHEVLRKMDEPRIHAAIVCASVSCPDLRAEAFVADRLDVQLDEQTHLWLASPEKGMRLDRERRTLYLSSIFDWFAEDFRKSDGSVPAFVARYAPKAERGFILQNAGALKLKYLDYDWALNAASRAEAGRP